MALRDKLKRFLDADLRQKAAEVEKKEIKPELMAEFAAWARANQSNKYELDTPDWKGHATYVAPTTLTEVDADRLRELVTDDVWAKVTEPAVDSKKLAAAVELGVISKDALQSCIVEKPRDGYVKFTGHPVETVDTIEVERTPKATKRRTVVRTR